MKRVLVVGCCVVVTWTLHLVAQRVGLASYGGDLVAYLSIPLLVMLSRDPSPVLVVGIATGLLEVSFPVVWMYVGIAPIWWTNVAIAAGSGIIFNMIVAFMAVRMVGVRRPTR